MRSGESLSGRAWIINTGSEPVDMRTLRTVFGGVALPGSDRLLGQFRGWQTTVGPSRVRIAAGAAHELHLLVGTDSGWAEPLRRGTYQVLAQAEVLVDGPPQRHVELRAVGPQLELIDS